MPGAKRDIVINANAQKCYEVIADFERYPDFVEEMKKVRVLSHSGDRWRVEYTIHIVKDIVYTLDLTGVPGKSLTWTLHSGWFKRNDGGWTLEELGPDKTRATYTVDIDVGPLVPKKILDMAVGQNFPAMLERFKKRIETGV